MKVSKADESHLTLCLAEKISQTKITHYSYAPVGREWEASVLSGLDESFVKALRERLDPGLEGLFQNSILRRFFDFGNVVPAEGNDQASLISYKGFSQPIEVARSIVAEINSIPLKYVLYMPANDCFREAFGRDTSSVQINKQLSIVLGRHVRAEGVFEEANEGLRAYLLSPSYASGYVSKIRDDGTYFRFVQSGFFTERFEPQIAANMSDAVRTLYAAMLSYGMLRMLSRPAAIYNPYVIANRVEGDRNVFDSVSRLDEDLRRANRLTTSPSFDNRVGAGEGLDNILAPMVSLFSSAEHQRLSTAGVWLLRARFSERGMDQVLASAISVEVLLGDKDASDRIGLTKLMANRCAYALGATSAERKEISEFFVQWYRVRSGIVHSGRMRITGEEK